MRKIASEMVSALGVCYGGGRKGRWMTGLMRRFWGIVRWLIICEILCFLITIILLSSLLFPYKLKHPIRIFCHCSQSTRHSTNNRLYQHV